MLSDEQRDRAPSLAELNREAYEDWLADTYEARYQEFCREYHLDPVDGQSVHIYEEEWEELCRQSREQ